MKVSPAFVEALASLTVPLRVSRSEPTGIWRSAVRGTNLRPLIPGTARRANADPAGTLTNTFPLTSATLTVLPRTGAGSPVGALAGYSAPFHRRTSSTRPVI